MAGATWSPTPSASSAACPHQLVEGFASTLEETLVADVILHVIDASAEDDEQDRQREAVDDVLHEIGAGECRSRSC